MKNFRPRNFVDTEVRALAQDILRAAQQPFLMLDVQHAAPEKVVAGMVCYFDGTDYDPGSGEGVYVRNSANTAWRYLG